MFPETDPYRGKGARLLDIVLILLAILIILFAVLSGPRRHHGTSETGSKHGAMPSATATAKSLRP